MDGQQKPKVLMLDDEKFLLDLYKLAFEKAGLEVRLTNAADEALAVLQSGFDPDIVLFDITMPDNPSGYEFLERVREEKLFGHSLWVALTNEGQDAEMARTKELGADAHLIKSNFVPSELAAVVQKMLRDRMTV